MTFWLPETFAHKDYNVNANNVNLRSYIADANFRIIMFN